MSTPKTAITPTRHENFSQWYQEIIKSADMAEHSVVRGCMIIKPWGYAIWENIQKHLDQMIKDTGHQNVYFPLLIPLSFLEKEAAHVEGFAKECAVVTHYRLEVNAQGKLVPAPDAELPEPLIVRPTSETVIGQAMAQWMQSYQDLPIKINQWCNIMRWEMRTRLFLRTSEFLWQEGHTAHSSAAEAQEETRTMLDVYEKLAYEFLAIPVFKGEKTASERFPGAVNTYTIEAMMQDGKALQSGTSHFLGQNFSTAYEMQFVDQQQQRQLAWTTSWGLSTRMIGALIMIHSDDDGLVLPPHIAPEQIRLIPVAMNEQDLARVLAYCVNLSKSLGKIRYGEHYLRIGIDKTRSRAGEKFWTAVKKGIPLRIEIGVREIESGLLSLTRRDKPAKEKIQISADELHAKISVLLDELHANLYQRALAFRNVNLHTIATLDELEKQFSGDETQLAGFALAYMDLSVESNANVVEVLKRLKISARCIPFEFNAKNSQSDIDLQTKGRCIFSGNETTTRVIFARAY